MVKKVTKKHSKRQVLGLMKPLIRDWFDSKFDKLTPPQAYAVPLIHQRKNVLISSPTGSGKTLTAFLSIINELMLKQEAGELEDKIYCVYVSPLKALANDIDKNLKSPLAELKELAKEKGIPGPEIRVAVRSGDTTQYERQKMARKPPHILITTPESLAIVLTTPKFSQNLATVEWLITDEIHEICSSKRGAMLSVTLERLLSRAERVPSRIGLSATQAPIEEIGKYLVGFGKSGRARPVNIVEAKGGKSFDLRVVTPVKDITALPFEIVNARMYEKLKDMIERHQTTLVFTNTRSATETVVLKLTELGLDNIAAHHGSLARETRLDVENRLKNGELKAVVSSTSLELGIDIGSIDLVCQIGSPKSIAKGLQRVGRSGHGVGQKSKGRFMVFDNDDLVECAVLAKKAADGFIDRVSIPVNSLDVLAQTLVGLSLERRWDIDEAYGLVKGSYTFHDLEYSDYLDTLRYLGSRDMPNVYSKLWLDEDEGTFGRKRGSRLIYYLNSGTIAEEANFKVFGDRGGKLGELSEAFVERLSPGDVFVLGGKSYAFERARGMSLFVRDATGRRPTVPSWTGEMLPRSFDLSVEISAFRAEVKKRLARGDDDLHSWLVKEYHLDPSGATSVISYFREQLAYSEKLPTDSAALVEGYLDSKGNRNLIFHYCFGRRVNDALSRAYAMAISQKYNTNVRVSITDDNFMLTAPRDIGLEEIEKLVTPDNLETLLRGAVMETELFKQRFRHTSTRGLMVLRNYKGRNVPVGRQQQRAQKVFRALDGDQSFPIVKETFNEIMSQVMDVDNTLEVLAEIEDGGLKVKYQDYSEIPSPFAHNVVLAGMQDIVLMHDRSTLLKELHQKVLAKVGGDDAIRAQFDSDIVGQYFRDKAPLISSGEDIAPLLETVGPLELFQRKDRSVYDFSEADTGELAKWCEELVNSGEAMSVWAGKSLWAAVSQLPELAALYAEDSKITGDEREILAALKKEKEPVSVKKLADAFEWETGRVRRALGNLERRFAASRQGMDKKGYGLWAVLKVRPSKAKGLRRKAIKRHLAYFGPMTIDELAFDLGMKSKEVAGIAGQLEKAGELMSGAFTEPNVQYMAAEDYARLKTGAEGDVVSEGQISAYHLKKHFSPCAGPDELFDRYGLVGMVNDVVARCGIDVLGDWEAARQDGEILQGRFWDGGVAFARKKDAKHYVSAYRREELNKTDRILLDTIERNPGADVSTLERLTDMPRATVKEKLKKLDRNLYVIRQPTEAERWTGWNRYEKFNARGSRSGYREFILLQMIRAYGPVTLYELGRATGFRRREVAAMLHTMKKEGEIAEVVPAESPSQKYYLAADELEDLKNTSADDADDTLRILTLYDPFAVKFSAEMRRRFGDAWYYPVFKGDRLVGRMEMWEMSGAVEVRQLDLEDGLLPEFLKALDSFSELYKRYHMDVLRVINVNGRDVPDMTKKMLGAFEKAGYFRRGDWLLKGALVEKEVSEDDWLAYVLWKQHVLPGRRFKGMMEAADELSGFRSDFAAMLRVRGHVALDTMKKKGLLVSGKAVPDITLYFPAEDVPLYKSAKDRTLTPHMEELLNMFEASGRPMKWREIIENAPLGYDNAREALKGLHHGLWITYTHDKYYKLTDAGGMSTEKARKEVVRRLFKSFGIWSAEHLSMFLKGEYHMHELRGIMKELEKDGKLVKGFLLKGDNTLYWLVKDDLEVLGSEIDTDCDFVVSSRDRLQTYLQPYVKEMFGIGSSFVVFKQGKPIGAFKNRWRKNEITITEYVGDDDGWKVIRDYSSEIGMRIKRHVETSDDMENIADWYEKYTRPGG